MLGTTFLHMRSWQGEGHKHARWLGKIKLNSKLVDFYMKLLQQTESIVLNAITD